MQFTSFALLGLGALSSFAAAAPAVERSFAAALPIEERTDKHECYCPKGKKKDCHPGKPPKDGEPTDVYEGCKQVGLLNLALLCDVLNGNEISIPITISLLDGLTL